MNTGLLIFSVPFLTSVSNVEVACLQPSHEFNNFSQNLISQNCIVYGTQSKAVLIACFLFNTVKNLFSTSDNVT